jgi:aryl-alcohol dehydrogenase-like predicted oxidoreductase
MSTGFKKESLMEMRSLGRTGVMVSPLCLGAMNFGGPTNEEESFAIMQKAVDAGINFFDTSNSYTTGESEKIVGKFLKENNLRERVFLATKVFSRMGEGPNDGGSSRYHIIKACEDSLRRLQTDHIDLYQQHRPSLTIPQDESLRAYDDLVKAGKVRYMGSSTFPAWLVMEALAVSEKHNLVRFISEQPPYNLLDRRVENELIPLCQRYGLAVLPWSPLAGGILAGRYASRENLPEGSRAVRSGAMFSDRITTTALEVAVKLAELAKERNLTSSQLALLWAKDQPAVTSPIIGPRTLGHLEDALPVMEMKLSDADRDVLDKLVHPGNAVADFHNSNPWMKARIF